MKRTLTAVLTRENSGFVALCPELDVASQGETVEEAKHNLQEAVELFFECASPEEIRERLSSESFVSTLEVTVAYARSAFRSRCVQDSGSTWV